MIEKKHVITVPFRKHSEAEAFIDSIRKIIKVEGGCSSEHFVKLLKFFSVPGENVVYECPWSYGSKWHWEERDLDINPKIKDHTTHCLLFLPEPASDDIGEKKLNIHIKDCGRCIHAPTCQYSKEYQKMDGISITSDVISDTIAKLSECHILMVDCLFYDRMKELV